MVTRAPLGDRFLGNIGSAVRRELRAVLRRPMHQWHPVPLRGLQRMGDRWRVCDEAGVVELPGPGAAGPGGLAEIDVGIVADGAIPPAAALLVDTGAGFDANEPIHLRRATHGRQATLVRLPRSVRALRLRIAPGANFDLAVVRIREISRAEALARLGGALLRRRLAEPKKIPVATRKLIETLFAAGPVGVMDRLLRKENDQRVLLYSDWRR